MKEIVTFLVLSSFLHSSLEGQTVFTFVNGFRSTNYDSTLSATSSFSRQNLAQVNMGSGVYSIGDNTFNDCTNLTTVIFSTNVTSVGTNAFYNCVNLTNLTLPANLSWIGAGAFAYCAKLQSVNIPENVSSIQASVFYSCTNLTNITLPSNLTLIGTNAFNYCLRLSSIEIPSKVSRIEQSAFSYSGLTNITVPNSVTFLGDYVFSSCSKLLAATIPSSVTNRYMYWFQDSSSLLVLNLGSGLEGWPTAPSLSSYPHPLQEINIGIQTPSISGVQNFLTECGSLTNILVDTNNSRFSSLDGVLYNKELTRIILVPRGKQGTFTMPSTITHVETNAFKNCTFLTNVLCSTNLIEIADSAFLGCKRLISINIPDTCTYIGDNAFIGCTRLVDAKVPNNYLAVLGTIGISTGQLSTTTLINSVADSIATNSIFINALAANEQFISAVANKIKSTTGNYGLVTITSLSNSLSESRTDGINNVLSNPNLWTLYTTNQIQNMAMGNLVLNRNTNGVFSLNYDIEQSTDLLTWTPYQALSLPLNGLPTNKAFVRIKLKNSQ